MRTLSNIRLIYANGIDPEPQAENMSPRFLQKLPKVVPNINWYPIDEYLTICLFRPPRIRQRFVPGTVIDVVNREAADDRRERCPGPCKLDNANLRSFTVERKFLVKFRGSHARCSICDHFAYLVIVRSDTQGRIHWSLSYGPSLEGHRLTPASGVGPQQRRKVSRLAGGINT